MGHGPKAERIPHMSHALRHLRAQAGLTQAGVVERVRAAGGSLSVVYYQQIETGKRFPSPPLRRRILTALDADQADLEHLLEVRPWEIRGPAAMPAPAPGGGGAEGAVTAKLHELIGRMERAERERLLEVAEALIRARR